LFFEGDAVAVEGPPAFARCLEWREVKECRSMHIHVDRKWLDGIDGNVIALIVISLLIAIAFAF
jgi:hypothetical protein